MVLGIKSSKYLIDTVVYSETPVRVLIKLAHTSSLLLTEIYQNVPTRHICPFPCFLLTTYHLLTTLLL